jgi:hypothetical protein
VIDDAGGGAQWFHDESGPLALVEHPRGPREAAGLVTQGNSKRSFGNWAKARSKVSTVYPPSTAKAAR